MTKTLRCGDVVPGCSAEVRANTDEEVLRQAAEHARTEHGIEQLDDATAERIRSAITTR